jgi:RNA polymerase sigma factor (TIGR02999 family)
MSCARRSTPAVRRYRSGGGVLGPFCVHAEIQPVDSALMSEITQLLDAAAAGNRQAAADLLPLVYDELRKLAAARMAAENPAHTLDATALVHEAYLRLIGDQQFAGKAHFFAAAAEAMRRVLVNHARDRNRLKRGGRRNKVDLDRLTGAVAASDLDLLELDDALDRLANEYPVAADLVKLRFFAGMTVGDAAEALGIPRRTADRHWAFARAWLADALGSG